MATVRPLKDLLARADSFIKTGSSNTSGSSVPQDNVVALAEKLACATSEVLVDETLTNQEFEKLAESFNRYHTALEIDDLMKIAQFEEKARTEGFNDEQIAEVVSRIASDRVSKTIPLLAALASSETA